MITNVGNAVSGEKVISNALLSIRHAFICNGFGNDQHRDRIMQ